MLHILVVVLLIGSLVQTSVDNEPIRFYPRAGHVMLIPTKTVRDYWRAIRDSGDQFIGINARQSTFIDMLKINVTRIKIMVNKDDDFHFPFVIIKWRVFAGHTKLTHDDYEHLCTIDADHYERWTKLVQSILERGGKITRQQKNGTFSHLTTGMLV